MDIADEEILNVVTQLTIPDIESTSAPVATQGTSIFYDTISSKICFIRTTGSVQQITGTRLYSAVVDKNGGGDFTTIYDAFDSGAKTVYVRSGIYDESQDIIIPNNGSIIGENDSKVNINLLGGSTISANGNNNLFENTGTISIFKNTNIVTGVGTLFLNLSVGDYILLDNQFYEILTISSNTSLIIVNNYNGPDLITNDYIAQTMINSISIRNITINTSTTIGISLSGVLGGNLDSISFVDSQGDCAIDLTNCFNININNILSTNCTSTSVCVNNCYNSTIINSSINNNTNDGIVLNESISCKCLSTIISNNGGVGISVKGKNNIVSLCTIENNVGNGINIESTSVDNIISLNQCRKNLINVFDNGINTLLTSNIV